MKPIILIPGIGGSILVRKGEEHKRILNKRLVDNRWINIYPYNPLSVNKWKQEMGMQLIRNHQGKIVNITPMDPLIDIYDYGGTKGMIDVVSEFHFLNHETQEKLEKAFQYRYFHTLRAHLHKRGYKDHATLLGFPYDFRRVLDPDFRAKTFQRLKSMIEIASKNNMDQPVVVVGHSLGCILMKWMLTTTASQEWIDQYIHRFICISAPFGGAMFSLRACLSGDYYVPLFHKVYKEEIQTNTGIVMCLPNPLVYNEDMPLVDVRKTNDILTIQDYHSLADQGNVSFQIWRDLYEPHMQDIAMKVKVPTHVICSIDKKTPSMYYTDTLDSYPYATDHTYGDGVVDLRSLMIYERLFDHRVMRDTMIHNTGHTQLLSDPRILNLICKYALS